MDERIALLKNTIIGQNYRIVSEIGRGGSCIVYEAEYKDNFNLVHRVRIKEFYPYQVNLERNDSGFLFCVDSKSELVFNEKKKLFERGYSVNVQLQSDDDFINTSVDAREIVEDNGTVYLIYSLDGGITLGKYKPKNIRECIEITIAVAQAVEKYHKNDYLHLDIKPDNILILNETKEMVVLFDYDSVSKICDIKLGYSKISYSEGFAAPELIRGNIARIGYGTDVFSIGAVLFEMLWDKVPSYSSMDFGATYDFEASNYFAKTIREDVYVKLTEFFHKTLSSLITKRYATVEEVIVKLQEIYELADSNGVYIVSAIPPKRFFIGRKHEKAEIEKILEDNQIVILSGIGGIGKSILAEDYILDHREEYDNIILTSMTEGLVELVCDDTKIALANFQIKEDKSLKVYAKRKLKKLRELCNDRTLILIDNVDTIDFGEDEWIWRELLSMDLKIIVTSRIAEWSYPVVIVSELEKNEKVMLFRKYCDSEEDEYIEKIIEIVQGHTALIELIAKQIDTSFSTAEDMYHILKERGVVNTGEEKVWLNKDNVMKYDSVMLQVKAIFDTAKITRRELYILHNLCLFSQDGLVVQEFKEYIDEPNFNNIKELIRKGWIQEKGQRKIALHTAISDVIRCDANDVLSDISVMLEKCIEKYVDICKKVLPSLIGKVRIEYKNKFSQIANYIVANNIYNDKLKYFIDIYMRGFHIFYDYKFCEKAYLYLVKAFFKLNSSNTDVGVYYFYCLTHLYIENKEYTKAVAWCALTTEKILSKYDEKHPLMGAMYMCMGNLFVQAKKYKIAEDFYCKAYSVVNTEGDYQETRINALIFGNLGYLYHYYRPEEAETYLLAALDGIKKFDGYDKNYISHAMMNCMINLGDFYTTVGRYEEAFEQFQEAKQICEQLFDGRGRTAIELYNYMIRYYSAIGNADKVSEINELIEKLQEDM